MTTYLKHHFLFSDAGVFGQNFEITEDGFELTFQVNYLSHFYLTHLLKKPLNKSKVQKVISVAAESHRFAGLQSPEDFSKDSLVSNVTNQKQFSSIYAYNDSKLCCLMFALSAHRQFGFKALAVHPGNMVCSYLSRNSWFCRFLFSAVRPFAKSLQQAAASGIFAAIGKYGF